MKIQQRLSTDQRDWNLKDCNFRAVIDAQSVVTTRHAVSCLWTQLPLQLRLNLWVCLMRLTRCSHAPAQILMVWLEFWSGLMPEYQIQKRETLLCWIFSLMFCFNAKLEYPKKRKISLLMWVQDKPVNQKNFWSSAHQDPNWGYFINNYIKNNKQQMTHVSCCFIRWLIFLGPKKPFR